jgi:hypothetical protein
VTPALFASRRRQRRRSLCRWGHTAVPSVIANTSGRG